MRIKTHKFDRCVRKSIKLYYKHIYKIKIYKGSFDTVGSYISYYIVILQLNVILTLNIPVSICYNNLGEMYSFIESEIQSATTKVLHI